MMTFSKTNEQIALEGISDFIEQSPKEIKEQELKKGVEKIVLVLKKNPAALMNILKEHPVIPASFMLNQLIDIMEKAKSLNELEPLFAKCLDTLTQECFYNLPDLERY